ncbi:MFS transporter [Isosphaeraceae bacterium EP7]
MPGLAVDHPSETPSKWNPLDALGLHRPELRAWAMYDWANSAMVTTIIAAVFPIFYSKVASHGLPTEVADRNFAWSSTIAMVIIAVVAPILGVIADQRPIKKKLLGSFMALGIAAVASMFFIAQGDWLLASVLFIVANIGANGSFVFYDAMLPHIADEHEIDRVSTAGYALGYVGGGLLLMANLAWILKPEWFGLPSGPNLTSAQASLPARLAFLSVAIWWLVFSIPLFLRVPEPKVRRVESQGSPIREAFARLGATFGELKKYRQGLLMLVAFLIYNDGIGTIFRMATIYGTSKGIDSSVMIASLVLVQFVGIPFAFLFGGLAGRFGSKNLILFTLVVYIFISILGYFMETSWHFVLLAILVGTVQGGSQALSRSLFAGLIPRDKSGEFFGFFAVMEKFAGIFGPALFAISIQLTGSTRNSILTVIPFFIVGGALLMMVNVEEGRKLAKAAEGSGTV